ncbi:MAG: hypothetical protein KBA95_01940 [Acidobacteria bacterium]|nr:hypothetical protein [Acidobacteriota bacterium]
MSSLLERLEAAAEGRLGDALAPAYWSGGAYDMVPLLREAHAALRDALVVGDRMRMSVELILRLEEREHQVLVKVVKVETVSDGTKMLWLSRAEPVTG